MERDEELRRKKNRHYGCYTGPVVTRLHKLSEPANSVQTVAKQHGVSLWRQAQITTYRVLVITQWGLKLLCCIDEDLSKKKKKQLFSFLLKANNHLPITESLTAWKTSLFHSSLSECLSMLWFNFILFFLLLFLCTVIYDNELGTRENNKWTKDLSVFFFFFFVCLCVCFFVSLFVCLRAFLC